MFDPLSLRNHSRSRIWLRCARAEYVFLLLLGYLTFASSVSATSFYWSLFNLEGESSIGAQYVTYATLEDMLLDENRLGFFDPDGTFSFTQANLVGSGSDGSTYWNLFNLEGESTIGAQYVTYATLEDMLLDENRLGLFDPDGTFSFTQANLVGSGAFFLEDSENEDENSDPNGRVEVPDSVFLGKFGPSVLLLGLVLFRRRFSSDKSRVRVLR